MTWIDAVGLSASVVTGIQVARQLWDVWWVPSPIAVSPLTWELALVQSLGLLILSVARGYTGAILINAFVAIGASLILVRVVGSGGRTGGSPRRAWPAYLVIALTTLAFVPITGLGGPVVAGDVGAAGAAFVWVPQAIRAYRLRIDTGLSRMGVGAGLVSSAMWIVYAGLVREWRLAVPGVTSILSLSVTAVYALWRTRARALEVGPPPQRSWKP